MRKFANNIRKLQQWWRMCSRKLREARDKVSERWKRLERAELARELNKAAPIPAKASSKVVAPKLSLEERIEMFKISDKVRLNFIEHELRTRRYRLLPAVSVWEEDSAKWRQEMEEWRLTRTSHLIVGSRAYLQSGFPRWPPPRPSYMPPCFRAGSTGDDQILDMYRRARKSPDGWLPVGRGGLKSKPGAQVVQEDAGEAGSHFPPADDGDLQLWRVDGDGLPWIASHHGGNPEPNMAPV